MPTGPGLRAATNIAAISGVEPGEVVERLAPNDDPGRAVGDEEDRRTGDLVVIGRHGVAVSARDRGGEDVADLQVIGYESLGHHQVAALAMLADDPHRPRARCR